MPSLPARIRTLLASAIVALSAGAAQAAPVTLEGTFSGARGSTITVNVVDQSLVDFEAADLQVLYAPTTLEFLSASLGSLLPGGTTFGANDLGGEVQISIGTPAPFTGGPGTLATLSFRILTDAPFTTSLLELLPYGPGGGAPVFDFTAVSETITVTRRPGGTAPLPGTLALMLAGVGALAWRSRGR